MQVEIDTNGDKTDCGRKKCQRISYRFEWKDR